MISINALGQAQLNRVWSAALLEELTRFGVSEVCVAPGSRSTPLTLEAELNPKLNLHTHFDERGLGFYALGMAKASKAPVAVVVTSGTAVANLLPAVAEANLTGEKLILLTADRPIDLVGCGANQAIVQSNIFSSHVVRSIELPSPSPQQSFNWLLSTLDDALFAQVAGPIHINCAFPEPLYTEEPVVLADIDEVPKKWLESVTSYSDDFTRSNARFDLEQWLSIHHNRKGLIVVGSTTLGQATHAKALSEELGWPILCDPQSGQSSDWASYDVWLQSSMANKALAQCEVILQFGARLVSKRLLAFIKKQAGVWSPDRYLLISDEPSRLNPDHLPMARAHGVSWPKTMSNSDTSGWGNGLKKWKEVVSSQVNAHASEALSELELTSKLSELSEEYNLFIGNSLGVRLVDMFSQHALGEVYSNRGASGIDGLVATCAGVSSAIGERTLLMLGDTSLLHDLNSLSLHRDKNNLILVINNDGGAIFDMLPVDASHKQKLYQMPHGYQFEHAAKQFGLDYAQVAEFETLKTKISEHRDSGTNTLLIEVITPQSKRLSIFAPSLPRYAHSDMSKRTKVNIVFVHGFLGSSEDWSQVISQLPSWAEGHCIDLPGHGKKQDLEPKSLDDFAAYLLSELKPLAKSKRPLVLVGYSLGARVLMYSLTHKCAPV
ncbi:2-succinyl-5-enolpyruvyl-6-hydroxy-3-cyclohexene-1-carboxylic-acid synthase [Vibrio sp. JCM 19236]|nr:2-succinyl-5-enolpyruvyl-6-hydroxy-3-cyclohexene-1-carboxylic-acid synthase [Vibrio sp. JCM 19236]